MPSAIGLGQISFYWIQMYVPRFQMTNL
jgi:hypothetical protein